MQLGIDNFGISRRWALVALLLTVGVASPVLGQSGSFKAGDDVQVFFLNKWWPAKVVQTNKRGDVLAEFEFAGQPKQQAFKRNEVRFEFEADAIAPARNWSDASGQFQILAALVRIDEEAITLRKKDMKEINVPVAKLSEGDQSFLKRLQKELGPAAARPPALPPLEQFDRSTLTEAGGTAGQSTERVALTADPLPSFLVMKEGGVAFPAEFSDRLGAVLPLGGADSWLLAAIESGGGDGQAPTRLIWASLGKKEIGGQQLLPGGEVILDYHQQSHRLLTYSASRPGAAEHVEALTLWEVLPGDKQAKPVVRWNAGATERASWEPWGRLIDGQTVLHRWKEHEYVVWDVAGKRIGYRINQEAFFAPLPTLSGSRKYLFLPEDKKVRVFEAASGRPLSALPCDDGAAAVALTEDGKTAAVLGRNTLTLFDLTDPSASPEKIQAEAIGSPFRAKLHWVDSQHVMADGLGEQVLFSLKHKLAVWSYRFDGDAVRETSGRRLRDVVAGHLVYAASVRAGAQHGLAVGAVKLPGPKVTEAVANLNPETLMVVKPGSSVRLDVRAGNETSRVQTALQAKISQNGWTLSPSANIALIAEMKQGQTQQVTYRSFGFGGGGDQTVTVTPFVSELRVEVDGKVAWSSGTSTGLPPILHLQQGQSAQSEVDKSQRPLPEFFEQVTLPARILDPAKRNGIGRTSVTNRGLIPD